MDREELRDVLTALQVIIGNGPVPPEAVNISEFSGAIGDGIVDDTLAVQRTLTYCSENNLPCYLPPHNRYLITRELFFWGGISMIGGPGSAFYINTSTPYVFNAGIKARQVLGEIWTGSIKDVTFRVIGSGGGRILFFWRSDGASIVHNTFYLGQSEYGPTSSGNNNNYVLNGHINCVRKNITITDNKVFAESDVYGSEGIGLNQWDGAVIARNQVYGVGDDMIGIHFCDNIEICDNTLSGTDGRLYVSNSRNVVIRNNDISRMPSVFSGLWHTGIALLYIGHEFDTTNSNYAPEHIVVENNRLTYPEGSNDMGAAIYVYSPRNVLIKNNTVTKNSALGSIVGLHLLPFTFVNGTWTDPTGLDTQNISKVYEVEIDGNNFAAGSQALRVQMTGATCTHYVGPVFIRNNRAGSYSFICNPVQSGNITVGM